jgi:hypothetical protein
MSPNIDFIVPAWPFKKRKRRYSNVSRELLHGVSSGKAREHFPNPEALQKQNGEYVYARAAVSGRSEQAARKNDCSDSTGASMEVYANWKE